MKASLNRRTPDNLQYLIGDEGFSCSSTLLTIVRSQEVEKITDPDYLLQIKGYTRSNKTNRAAARLAGWTKTCRFVWAFPEDRNV